MVFLSAVNGNVDRGNETLQGLYVEGKQAMTFTHNNYHDKYRERERRCGVTVDQ